MRSALCFLLILLLCWQPPWLLGQDGKLEKVREAVHAKGDQKPSSDDSKKKKDDNSCSAGDGDDDGDGFCAQIAAAGLKAACWLITEAVFIQPAHAVGDHYDNDGYFNRYPYADHRPGYMWLQRHPNRQLPDSSTCLEDGDDAQPADAPDVDWRKTIHLNRSPAGDELLAQRLHAFSARLWVDESNDFDGLNRVSGQVLVETLSRFGLLSDMSYLHENLSNGRHDEMFLGDANLTFRFAQSEKVQLRTGLGFRWLADRHDSAFGVNFLYGGDFFPVKPLVVSTVMELGTLGSATVFHARATAGLMHSRWELFAGFDWLRIGSVDLHGPVAGVRLWF
jgi:hypothetical protein